MIHEIDIEIKNKHTLKVKTEDPKFKYESMIRNVVDVGSRVSDFFEKL